MVGAPFRLSINAFGRPGPQRAPRADRHRKSVYYTHGVAFGGGKRGRTRKCTSVRLVRAGSRATVALERRTSVDSLISLLRKDLASNRIMFRFPGRTRARRGGRGGSEPRRGGRGSEEIYVIIALSETPKIYNPAPSRERPFIKEKKNK